MGRFAMLWVVGLMLAGCAQEVREDACKVFSPAPIETPSTQNNQHIDEHSSGGPDGGMPEQRC